MADAESKLRQLIDKIASENNFTDHEIKIKAINSEGANFTSALFLVSITIPKENDLELFAKIAVDNDNIRELVNVKRLYHCEVYFYDKLVKIYEELMVKHEIPAEKRFVYPKCYGYNASQYEETVIMENLEGLGYENYDRLKSLDWEHAVAAIEALARFHALSFAFQIEQPKKFEQVCEDLVFEMNLTMEDPKVAAFAESAVKKCVDALRNKHKAPVVQCLKALGNHAFRDFYRDFGPKVIVHGDYRPSNLLFKKLDGKLHAIPVDYQGVKAASPVTDLIYLEVLGTDGKFRGQNHDRLMNLYHEELAIALQRLKVDVNKVYPKEVFERELKQMYHYSIFLSVAVLPLVLTEAENHPSVKGGTIDTFNVPSNQLYASRLNELVEDNLRWGFI